MIIFLLSFFFFEKKSATEQLPGAGPFFPEVERTILPGSLNGGRASNQRETADTDESEIFPATQPIVPDQEHRSRTPLASPCSGGLINPQWRTVEPWSGPQDYHLLEGVAHWSRISRKDSPFNHHTQDFLFGVQPDPAFNYLLSRDGNASGHIVVEWEAGSFPEAFRPTRGDRVSVLGYWVMDCGHEPNDTEIHPPVMVAVHRARPVKLEGYGANVIVPGIITDLWINEEAGKVTDHCRRTGLHQPAEADRAGSSCSCLPQSAGFAKNPLKRKISFRVYLPEDPQKICAEAGWPAPPQAPLFIKIYDPYSSGGPEPQVTPDLAKGYLEVMVDLTNYQGGTYSRKISSAWALPSPSNWGLKAWKVKIKKLEVHQDGDGYFNQGDWRFWVNLNNAGQEWTQLYNCDGCVHGTMDHGNDPWTTGAETTGKDRSLGPDIRLFPGQKIWSHTSGFEKDHFWSDYTGEVNDLFLPETGTTFSSRSFCQDDGLSNCGEYTIHYEVTGGGILPLPVLNAKGQAIFDDYLKCQGR